MNAKRDDFSQGTKDLLARRVGGLCSNPSCRKFTIGPSVTDEDKSISIGVASHITAAAEGGPRYDSSLTPEQRKSPENGIWLCQDCGHRIDADDASYTVDMLRSWKQDAENYALCQIHTPANARSGPGGTFRVGMFGDFLTELLRVYGKLLQQRTSIRFQMGRLDHPFSGSSRMHDEAVFVLLNQNLKNDVEDYRYAVNDMDSFLKTLHIDILVDSNFRDYYSGFRDAIRKERKVFMGYRSILEEMTKTTITQAYAKNAMAGIRESIDEICTLHGIVKTWGNNTGLILSYA